MDKIKDLIEDIKTRRFFRGQIKDIAEIRAMEPLYAETPGSFSAPIQKYLEKSGIEKLYIHQQAAIDVLRRGKNVVITTPTASGKTLAFNIPVFETLGLDTSATALYIYPAKALSNDQLKIINEMQEASGLKLEPGIYDGDTPSEEKKYIRENSRLIITNPYELHQVLPYHAKWKRFYKNLRFIVLDEAHRYKGIFGSNIAFLIRRLKRIVELYGAKPQFVVSSASLANPLEFIEKLTGESFVLVDENGSPSGKKQLVFWDSSMAPEKSVHTQTKDLLLHTSKAGFQRLAFTTSRRMAELIRMWANQEDKSVNILCYRAGYSPELRRDIEKQLKSGEIKGVVSTNALELGIDIGQLDIIIISGFPGSISSFWQQAGRAGRKMQESGIFFLPFEDALEKYLLRHPEILLNMHFENAIISLENPNILIGHVLCALSEAPSMAKDVFSDMKTDKLIDMLVEQKVVSETPRGYIYAGGARPQEMVSLDNIGGSEIKIKVNNKILETISKERAFSEAHEGAVYLHNGETYVIKELNIEEGVAIAAKENVEHYTDSVKDEEVKILEVKNSKTYDNFRLFFGVVSVTEIYKSYRIKKGGKILSYEDLHLPPLTFTTEAVWIELDGSIESKIKKALYDFDGAIHAAEHSLIALSPLFAMCDRNDIGGRSYPVYPENGSSIIFIYDGYEGGIGIAEKLFDIFPSLAANTYDMVKNCGCESGCPSCVYSPKCGNNNNPIDKLGAILMLEELK